jgi:ABC-type amino acid transport system permease subunit
MGYNPPEHKVVTSIKHPITENPIKMLVEIVRNTPLLTL